MGAETDVGYSTVVADRGCVYVCASPIQFLIQSIQSIHGNYSAVTEEKRIHRLFNHGLLIGVFSSQNAVLI